jgi:hypothetical protein
MAGERNSGSLKRARIDAAGFHTFKSEITESQI